MDFLGNIFSGRELAKLKVGGFPPPGGVENSLKCASDDSFNVADTASADVSATVKLSIFSPLPHFSEFSTSPAEQLNTDVKFV